MATANPVRARLLEVDRQIDHHTMSLAVLRSERERLNITMEEMERLGMLDTEEMPPVPQRMLNLDLPTTVAEHKPQGIKIPDMILILLQEDDFFGGDGLEPKELTSKIRERWLPDAKATSVSSIAWRMSDKKQVAKNGLRYCVRKSETPAVSPAGASEPGDASTPLFDNPSRDNGPQEVR